MLKYVGIFSGIYLFCVVVAVAASIVFQFDLPPSMGIIVLVAALALPVQGFVKDHQRVFSAGERAVFATGVGLAVLVLNLGLGLAFLYGVDALLGGRNEFQAMIEGAARDGVSMPMVLLIVAAGSFVLSWIITFFTAPFFARRGLKKLAAT
jgi:hypothetical protein